EGVGGRKGGVAVGADADVVVWDPGKTVRLSAAMLHDRAGYTPYEGREITGWPETVLSRGRIVVRDGSLHVAPGSGRFLPRNAGEAAQPLGRPAAEFAGASAAPGAKSRASAA